MNMLGRQILFIILLVGQSLADPTGDKPEAPVTKERLIQLRKNLKENRLHAMENVVRRKKLVDGINLMVTWMKSVTDGSKTGASFEKKIADLVVLEEEITKSIKKTLAKVTQISTNIDTLVLELDGLLSKSIQEDDEAILAKEKEIQEQIERYKKPLEDIGTEYNEILARFKGFAVHALGLGFRFSADDTNGGFDFSPFPTNGAGVYYEMSPEPTLGEIIYLFLYHNNVPSLSKKQVIAIVTTFKKQTREILEKANERKTATYSMIRRSKVMEDRAKILLKMEKEWVNKNEHRVRTNGKDGKGPLSEEEHKFIKDIEALGELYDAVLAEALSIKVAIVQGIAQMDILVGQMGDEPEGEAYTNFVLFIKTAIQNMKTFGDVINANELHYSQLTSTFESARSTAVTDLGLSVPDGALFCGLNMVIAATLVMAVMMSSP